MRQSRKKLTSTLVQQLKEPTEFDDAMTTWWHNPLDSGGLRLTFYGFIAFTNDLDIEYHTWEFPNPKYLKTKMLLQLDRKLESPYYIQKTGNKEKQIGKLMLFGAKDMTMLTLVGDLEKFLDKL